MNGEKIVEAPRSLVFLELHVNCRQATSLRGRELRWQPWPDVGQFNGEWKVIPLRWGLRGEPLGSLEALDWLGMWEGLCSMPW